MEGAATMDTGGEEEDLALPVFEHKTKTITYPTASRPLPPQVAKAPHIQAFFDGGAAGKQGTGGFVVFGTDEVCMVAHAMFYGENLGTNNRAEARALRDLMQWLAEHAHQWANREAIVIYGDSQLIINFCNRRARPSVGDLY